MRETGRHDVESVDFAIAVGATLAVATHPQRRTDGLGWHAEQLVELAYVDVVSKPLVT